MLYFLTLILGIMMGIFFAKHISFESLKKETAFQKEKSKIKKLLLLTKEGYRQVRHLLDQLSLHLKTLRHYTALYLKRLNQSTYRKQISKMAKIILSHKTGDPIMLPKDKNKRTIVWHTLLFLKENKLIAFKVYEHGVDLDSVELLIPKDFFKSIQLGQYDSQLEELYHQYFKPSSNLT